MTKLRQRERRRARTRPHRRPTAPGAPALSQTPAPTLGGLTPDQVCALGGLLAEDLHHAALTARARARGGSPPASVVGHFLVPLKRVYQAMDMVSEAVRTQPQTALTPACTPGCFACCRLYVEVGPWEAFGIADYVTQACDAGAVARETVLARLQDEVTRFGASGGDKGAMRLCAFLSRDGHCGIYPARPAACRSYYSRSRADCERYFGQPNLGETRHPSVVRTPTQGVTAQLSIAETLATAQAPFPLDAAPPFYEMQSMVLRILETPNALIRYLNGEEIFQGCVHYHPEPELRAARDRLVQLQLPAKGFAHA